MKEGTDKYKFCNHHHELDENYEVVDFGTGPFVANKPAIPLLKALNELGLITRTHHISNESKGAFFSILLRDDVRIEVKTVKESDSTRTQFDGEKELLISWNK